MYLDKLFICAGISIGILALFTGAFFGGGFTPNLWILIIYPILEEWTFRTHLQSALLSRPTWSVSILGVSRANIVCAVSFAILHLLYRDIATATGSFAFAIVVGYVYEKNKSLLQAVLLHVGANSLYVIGARFIH